MKRVLFLLLLIVIISCGKKEEKIETASNDIKVNIRGNRNYKIYN